MANSKTALTQQRVEAIYKLMLYGARRRDIMAYAKKEKWDVKTRQIDKYIAAAKGELAEVQEEERRGAFGIATKRLDYILSRSLAINDYKTALQVQKEINALHGLSRISFEHTVEVNESGNLRDLIDKAIAADPTCRDRITAALEKAEEEEGGGEV